MNEPPEFGSIVACAAIAAVCGGATFAASLGIALSMPGASSTAIFAALVAAMVGVIVSIFTAWPLGVLIGWLSARAMGMRPQSAVVAGLVTALAMSAIALGGDLFRSGADPAEVLWLGWFCLIGAGSGLLGYRVTIGPVFKRNLPESEA